MQKTKPKNDTPPIKVFKQSPWAVIMIMVVIGLFIVQLVISGQAFASSTPFEFIVIAGVSILYAVMIVVLFNQLSAQIEIYDNGIGSRHGNSYAFTEWENCWCFDLREQGRSHAAGIITHDPIEKHVNGGIIERMLHHQYDPNFIELIGVRVPQQSDGLLKGYSINLEQFKKTEFGEIVYYYAPHIFGDDDLIKEKIK
ncbi:MAG: hypothetical protein WBC91_24770 [Phototrophicaceae bacterium]